MALKYSLLLLFLFCRETQAAAGYLDNGKLLSYDATSKTAWFTVLVNKTGGGITTGDSITQFCVANVDGSAMTATDSEMEVWIHKTGETNLVKNIRTTDAVTLGLSDDNKALCGTLTATAVADNAMILVKVVGLTPPAGASYIANMAGTKVEADGHTASDALTGTAVAKLGTSYCECGTATTSTAGQANWTYKCQATNDATAGEGPTFWTFKTVEGAKPAPVIHNHTAADALFDQTAVTGTVAPSTGAVADNVVHSIIMASVAIATSDTHFGFTHGTDMAAAKFDSNTLVFCTGSATGPAHWPMKGNPFSIVASSSSSSDSSAVRSLGVLGAGLIAAVAMFLN